MDKCHFCSEDTVGSPCTDCPGRETCKSPYVGFLLCRRHTDLYKLGMAQRSIGGLLELLEGMLGLDEDKDLPDSGGSHIPLSKKRLQDLLRH